jgi:GDP-D-mannose dehydratase
LFHYEKGYNYWNIWSGCPVSRETVAKKGYEVLGFVRRNSSMSVGNLQYLGKDELAKIEIHYGDLTDAGFFATLLKKNSLKNFTT